MSYRLRLTLLTCIAVASTLAVAALTIYGLARHDAYQRIDDALERQVQISRAFERARGDTQATGIQRSSNGGRGRGDDPGEIRGPQLAPGAAGGYFRVLDAHGDEVKRPAPPQQDDREQDARRAEWERLPADIRRDLDRARRVDVPITDDAKRLARRGGDDVLLETVQSSGLRYRVVTAPINEARTAQIARPLDEVNSSLDRLALILVVVTAMGTALGLVAALFVTRAATAPVRQLTELAVDVRRHADLSRRVDAGGDDDLARLAHAFNEMLEELERSVGQQQRLIDDASHELRTPLASIRTNLDLLWRATDLDETARSEVLVDLSQQVDELTALVRDLVDLASNVNSTSEPADVRLDEVVADAVRRVRGGFPDHVFDLRIDPVVVLGSAERIGRMVHNLVHNAAKYSPPGSTVEVSTSGSTLFVSDRGAGIADADKSRVFERFYRGAQARDTAGSGLGLAIVQDVASTHGATVAVTDRDGGGSIFAVRFPPVNDAGSW